MTNTINTTATTSLAKGEILQVKVVKGKTYFTPPYHCLGRFGQTHFVDESGLPIKVQGIDAISILKDLSSAGTWLFWTLVQSRDINSNVSYLPIARLSSCEVNRLKKSYKELKENQFIVRLKPEYYLINPKVIVPFFEHYQSVQLRWDQAISK